MSPKGHQSPPPVLLDHPDILQADDSKPETEAPEDTTVDLSENPAAESLRIDSTTLDATVVRNIRMTVNRGESVPLIISGFSSSLRQLTISWDKLPKGVAIARLFMLSDDEDEDDEATEKNMKSEVDKSDVRPKVVWKSPAMIPSKNGYSAVLQARSTHPEQIDLRLEYILSKRITWRPKTIFKFSGLTKLRITYEAHCYNASREAFTNCQLEVVAPLPPGAEPPRGHSSISYRATDVSTTLPANLETATTVTLGHVETQDLEFSWTSHADRERKKKVLEKVLNRFIGEAPGSRSCKIHLLAKIRNAWVFPGAVGVSLDNKHVGTRRDFIFENITEDVKDGHSLKGCIEMDVGPSDKYTKHIKVTAHPPNISKDTVVHSTSVRSVKPGLQKVRVTEAIPLSEDLNRGWAKVRRASIQDMESKVVTPLEVPPDGAEQVKYELEFGKPGVKICELEFER